ncbi:hypothetical protein [Ascidiimonas sp. W6]|uniref:hypothetical protein n=1 Tax=Ascidiimonas meishanensis TaxID=3128903 RepID=UPI0030ED08B6
MKKAKLNQLNLKKLTVSKLSESIKGGKHTVEVSIVYDTIVTCQNDTERSTCADSVRVCWA